MRLQSFWAPSLLRTLRGGHFLSLIALLVSLAALLDFLIEQFLGCFLVFAISMYVMKQTRHSALLPGSLIVELASCCRYRFFPLPNPSNLHSPNTHRVYIRFICKLTSFLRSYGGESDIFSFLDTEVFRFRVRERTMSLLSSF